MYEPDEDATPVDRSIMAMAGRLHNAGWTHVAEDVAGDAAELREYAKLTRNDGEPMNAEDLHRIMEIVRDAAQSICTAIELTFADPHELKDVR